MGKTQMAIAIPGPTTYPSPLYLSHTHETQLLSPHSVRGEIIGIFIFLNFVSLFWGYLTMCIIFLGPLIFKIHHSLTQITVYLTKNYHFLHFPGFWDPLSPSNRPNFLWPQTPDPPTLRSPATQRTWWQNASLIDKTLFFLDEFKMY